LKRYDLLIR